MQSPPSGPAVASTRSFGIIPTVGGSYFALAVLFSMNLLNYVDRYSFFAVGTHIQNLFGKVEVHSRGELVARAYTLGLVNAA